MSRPVRGALSALALAAAWPATASARQTAEAFLADRTHANAFRATVGLDPALAIGADYVRGVDVGSESFSRRLGIHFDVTSILGLSSWDFTGGVSLLAREQTGIDVLTTVDLALKLVQNDVHTGLAYGDAASVRPGWFDSSWYAALDLSLRGTYATTVFHSDA